MRFVPTYRPRSSALHAARAGAAAAFCCAFALAGALYEDPFVLGAAPGWFAQPQYILLSVSNSA